jgi:hypothetical protein
MITLLVYFIAFKLGAFKNRKKEGFENDWKELSELKAISSELERNKHAHDGCIWHSQAVI